MVVWIVHYDIDYEFGYVVGVFTTEKAARACVIERTKNAWTEDPPGTWEAGTDTYTVTGWDVEE